jgi:uncharacterized protein (TIGR03435 family)
MMRRLGILLAGTLVVSACYAQAPARLEFDAASVKPSPPPDPKGYSTYLRGGPGTPDPGLFRCVNFSLSNLINVAYGLGANQLSAPDWMSATMFDIDARVPEGATHDQFRAMLQNLLADRFKLVVHHETRESTEYRLEVAKGGPKLKPAGNEKPEESTPDTNPPPAVPKPMKLDSEGYPEFEDGKGGVAVSRGRARMSEPRMTMEGLAGMLAGYLRTHVIDATGLEGQFAIDLRWVMDQGPSASADETPGPTLVEAVQKQLGLRLEKSANGTKDVLVVDHAEKAPTAN